MTDIGRVSRSSSLAENQRPEVEDVRRGSLRLGSDHVDVQPSSEHVLLPHAPVSQLVDGGQVDQVGQEDRAQLASLRDRTVPRWQSRGALTGTIATTLAAGTAGGVLIGVGKGALLGAAFGSIIPGAGTAVGAIVGGAIGGIVAAVGGGLIGRLAAGGGDRERAEKAIIGLQHQGKITLEEASRLKGMSNAELKGLVSISARKTGITSKADRDHIRRAVLLTAAKQGPEAARLLKAELLNMKPPAEGEELEESLAAKGAQNRLAVQPHLTSSNDQRFAAVSQNPTRLDEHQRFILDAVAAKSRSGQLLDTSRCASCPGRP
jgi:hypothetical protein